MTRYIVRTDTNTIIGGSDSLEKCYELIDAQEVDCWSIEEHGQHIVGGVRMIDTTIQYAPNS